ncbi:hypothetical protein [Celeribacter indicus]|nr:hypothetical protein [Celeribacter indicus]
MSKPAAKIVPLPAIRRGRKRLGTPLADDRAAALKARFSEVSKTSTTGSAATPLKMLLNRF